MKYYLLRYDFYSSVGGYMNDLDIIQISDDREEIIKTVKELLVNKGNHIIESINEYSLDEFEFDESKNQWEVRYVVDGMTINDDTVIKIVKR